MGALFDICKVCYNFHIENYIEIRMNCIRENKNKKSFQLAILQKAKLWWDGIIRSKKTKPLILVSAFVLTGVFFVIPTAHALWPPFSWLADTAAGAAGAVVSAILWAIQNLMLLLMAAAGSLFSVVISPANISGPNGILNKQAIRDVWVMTRDTLNMFFILVLLFSAFCTIFQIEKWSLKKVWLSILINALLVNFSYPIARFIIDISNVAMYYFVNNMFTVPGGMVTGNSIFSDFGAVMGLGKILAPEGFAQYGLMMQFTLIIYTFILAMTFLVVAVLFVVRIAALAILIMFSPIGFVGNIFPATASFAEKWWKNLFNYSFFAPIMIFGIAVSLKVSQAIADENFTAFLGFSAASMPAKNEMSPSWVAQLSFFAIPIIILWMFMGVAKSMGIAGADAVVGGAQKFAKGAGKKFSGYNWAKKNVDAFKSEKKKRDDEINKNRFGGRLMGTAYNDTMDKIGAKIGSKEAQKRYDTRKEAKNKDKIKLAADALETKDAATIKAKNEAHIKTPPTTDEAKMEFAAHAKAAIARGKKYEDEFEKDLKEDMKKNRGNYADFDAKSTAHEEAQKYLKDHEAKKPKELHAGATEADHMEHQTKMADWSAKRAQYKDDMDKAQKEVDKEEKRIIQEQKTKHLDDLRKGIQVGEDIGKMKPR